MSRITTGVIALLALLPLRPMPVHAQADADSAAAVSLPSADSIFSRYIEAIGGRDVLSKPTGTHALGTFELPAQGIAGDLEVFGAAPARLLVRINIPGLGLIRSGYDGEVGWSLNPAVGPMVLEGRMLDQMRQEADFYGPLSRSKYVASMETVGTTEFEGRPCYEVKVVTKWDEEYTEFYDVESGLLAGSVRTQESPMGAIETTTILMDYEGLGGIMAPTLVTQRMLGQEQVMRIDSVSYGAVSDTLFVLPTEIKALISP